MSWRLASGGLALVVTAGSMAAEEGDPFAFYRDRDTRPLATIIATDYTGYVDAGVRYVSEDSFNFGRYNGLSEDGAYADLNMDLRGDSDSGFCADQLRHHQGLPARGSDRHRARDPAASSAVHA